MRENGLDANTLIRVFENNVYIINLISVELSVALNAEHTQSLRGLAVGTNYNLTKNRVEMFNNDLKEQKTAKF